MSNPLTRVSGVQAKAIDRSVSNVVRCLAAIGATRERKPIAFVDLVPTEAGVELKGSDGSTGMIPRPIVPIPAEALLALLGIAMPQGGNVSFEADAWKAKYNQAAGDAHDLRACLEKTAREASEARAEIAALSRTIERLRAGEGSKASGIAPAVPVGAPEIPAQASGIVDELRKRSDVEVSDDGSAIIFRGYQGRGVADALKLAGYKWDQKAFKAEKVNAWRLVA